MHITSVIIDGFKSYGHRTEIEDFDPEFNAITGLNGSGKSNILDSICFVLGISNLSQVRAGSLQDLIYKNGQAGITKATVTVKFDNRVKSKSPIGYENKDEITITRQIVIGGKNKYMINGAIVTNTKVSDLFCSIQLNVNNPNFLIMQGRITKVLNMKPLEILSLIEEAAGTSMYEAKREHAKKTLDKKQSKLDHFNEVLRDEFKPRLDRLKNERDQYQTYNKLVRELEILKRRLIACHYVACKKERDSADSVQQRSVKIIEECQQKLISNEKESLQIDKIVENLHKKKSAESGGHLAELESDLKEKSKKQAKLFASYKSSNETIDAEESRLKNLISSLEVDQNMLQSKSATSAQSDTVFLTLKETYEKDAAAVIAAQTQLQAASAGMSTDDQGQSATLQDQLMEAEKQIINAETQQKAARMELNHCTTELKEKKRDLTNSDADYKKTKKAFDDKKQELLRCQAELDGLSFSDEHLENLEQKHRYLNEKCRSLRECKDRFTNTNPFCSFSYTDPEPNFDKSRVKGVVCKLFSVKNEIYMTALETCAGGRLYDVVVDTEVTAKKVLEKGNLKSRRTIIPLNKISGKIVDDRTIETAQRVGGGRDNVQLALHQIEFDDEISTAMSYIFGQTFLCKNMDVARKVAFDPNVRRRCVTLDGDVVDPAGTLSGGSRAKAGSLLLKIQELTKSVKELPNAERELTAIIVELRKLQDVSKSYKLKKNDLSMLKLEFDGLQRRLHQNPYHLQQEEIKKLEEEIENLQESINSCKNVAIENTNRAAELKEKLKDSKGYREKEIKKAEDNLKKCQKNALTSQEKWKEREQEFESMKLEIVELTKSIDIGKNQIESLKESIIQLKEDSKNVFREFNDIKEKVSEIEDLVKSQKDEINKQNKEIQHLLDKKQDIIKQNGELELEIKKEEQELKKLKNSAEDNTKKCAELLKSNPWIASEEENFNQPGSSFDITSINVKNLQNNISSKTEQKNALERVVNERAMRLLGQEEALLANVEKKKAKVERDKETLVKLIKNLDNKKKDILVEAWKQVNKDFGSIFTTLLEGASAKLEPLPGKSVVEGVEIKVGFNNVWKDSLNELSGGQRSLVALSLILAMLLFNPAPLYILDEIDAALDLSHTQNIGQMLKTHFKSSQFIIVSLKEGMFNNANVLFQTKFISGLSTVTRTAQN